MVQKGLTDRCLVGNLSGQAVRLRGTHDEVGHFLIELLIIELYTAADIDLTLDRVIHDLNVLQQCLELDDSRLDVSLLILRCIVLCVLGKIALLSRFLDLLCDHLSLVDLQIMKLRLILVKTCTCQ